MRRPALRGPSHTRICSHMSFTYDTSSLLLRPLETCAQPCAQTSGAEKSSLHAVHQIVASHGRKRTKADAYTLETRPRRWREVQKKGAVSCGDIRRSRFPCERRFCLCHHFISVVKRSCRATKTTTLGGSLRNASTALAPLTCLREQRATEARRLGLSPPWH